MKFTDDIREESIFGKAGVAGPFMAGKIFIIYDGSKISASLYQIKADLVKNA